MKYETIQDATYAFVNEFNSYPEEMISKLISVDPDEWREVTMPSVGVRVYCFNVNDSGEITKIFEDEDGNKTYTVELDNGKNIKCKFDELETEDYGSLPMWGTMWQFSDSCDTYWIEEKDGVEVMSELGFKVWYSEEFGYFFRCHRSGSLRLGTGQDSCRGRQRGHRHR